jgi:2-amino-4-hydroxy-6-hydroxymethyldihydropteridine diphosphokinase
VITAAVATIGEAVLVQSTIAHTAPLGPSARRYANCAIMIETALKPNELLSRLKKIERSFGRRRGQRWGTRVLDLDIILWSGGIWASPGLSIPHPAFRTRSFVLNPLAQIAPGWRDPTTGLFIRHLKARLDRKPPLP